MTKLGFNLGRQGILSNDPLAQAVSHQGKQTAEGPWSPLKAKWQSIDWDMSGGDFGYMDIIRFI